MRQFIIEENVRCKRYVTITVNDDNILDEDVLQAYYDANDSIEIEDSYMPCEEEEIFGETTIQKKYHK